MSLKKRPAQCSPKLQAHLQQLPFYDKADSTHNCIALLENANVLCVEGNLLAFQPQARAEALLDLVQYKQLNGTLDDYCDDFKARYPTFNSLGGDLTTKEDTWTTANGTTASANQALLVCLVLANADRKRFRDCVTDLRNDASSKLVCYPETLADAYSMLGEYVRKHKKHSNNNNICVVDRLGVDPTGYGNHSYNFLQCSLPTRNMTSMTTDDHSYIWRNDHSNNRKILAFPSKMGCLPSGLPRKQHFVPGPPGRAPCDIELLSVT
ncbi:unnamed protein product [Cylindrotheca closterium]|uniref:Uncharacterized protein n=1 Tax=Cylindrotheca closterium TaxID=2856 RepID=A0AAD2CLW6_9STRA|nr:unnamed protein product [Cylindrotheca closterium]